MPSCAAGLYGASHGANAARSTSSTSTTIASCPPMSPTTARHRRGAPSGSARRPAGCGSSMASAATEGVLRTSCPWVGGGVREIGDQPGNDDHAAREQRDAKDYGMIAIADGVERNLAESGPRIDRFH